MPTSLPASSSPNPVRHAIPPLGHRPEEAWERKAYPMEEADPVEIIKLYMEQNELEPKDLVPMIGHGNRVYEVLNRKRPLTLRMIRNLHEAFWISADALIKKSALPQGA